MKDNEKVKNKSADDDKLHISKSVFQNAREMQEKAEEEQKRQQEEMQRKLAERERRRREARDKRLEEERKELIRLKQGIIEESEIIHEEKEEEIQLSFFQKISNFFYHAKWWLVMGVLGVVLVVYLVSSLITRPRPDLIVLFVGENQTVGDESELAEYFEQFTPDNNGNGEVLVSVYYIPYTDDPQKNYTNGVDTKITAEFQSADSVIVIGNNMINEIVKADEIFTDLNELYPDNPNVDKYRFNLSGTGFAEKIGVSEKYIKDGLFMAVRKPARLVYSDLKDMEETYERDFPVFDSIIKDLSSN